MTTPFLPMAPAEMERANHLDALMAAGVPRHEAEAFLKAAEASVAPGLLSVDAQVRLAVQYLSPGRLLASEISALLPRRWKRGQKLSRRRRQQARRAGEARQVGPSHERRLRARGADLDRLAVTFGLERRAGEGDRRLRRRMADALRQQAEGYRARGDDRPAALPLFWRQP